nr:hypothetical protein CFP56_11162 [Quercus suber]
MLERETMSVVCANDCDTHLTPPPEEPPSPERGAPFAFVIMPILTLWSAQVVPYKELREKAINLSQDGVHIDL